MTNSIKSEGAVENVDMSLVVDDDIITHLVSLANQKNVKHKIVEVKNLLNKQLYEQIIQENETEKDILQKINKIDEITESKETKAYEITNGKTKETNVTSNGLLQNEIKINHYDVFSKFINWDELSTSNILSLSYDMFSKNSREKKESLQKDKQIYEILFLCYDGYNQYDTHCKFCTNNINRNTLPKNMNSSIYNDSSVHFFQNYFFVLGSTSASRKHILETAEIQFLTVPIKIDESSIGCRKQNDPLTLTANISIGKGLKLLSIIKKDSQLRESIIQRSNGKKILLVVGDEVIYCNNSIYEKPKNIEEAEYFLNAYRDNKCYSYCGLTVIDLQTEHFITGVDETVINMSAFQKDSINVILKDPSVLYCAGALKIENQEMCKYVLSIQGSIQNIFGLSINLLMHLVNLL